MIPNEKYTIGARSSIIIISCLGLIVYSNAFHCSFHLDDFPSIVNNPFIRNIHHLKIIWGFLPRRFILYLSIAFNYHFNGLDVLGYHLFNLGIHLVSAVLVWWLVLLSLSTPVMKEDKIARHANVIALLAGLVFVSHPLQTEAVTYIVQRAASMATMFYVASLCFYVKSRLLFNRHCEHFFRCHCEERSDEAISKRINSVEIASLPTVARNDTILIKSYYTCSLITALAAMFTKEMAITLPLMILFYEFSFFKKKGSMNWKYLAPFLSTMFIIPITVLLTETGAERIRQLYSEPGISSTHYLLTQFRVMVTYIRLVFFPLNQNIDYDYPVFNNIFEWPVLSSLLFLISVPLLAKSLFSKYRMVSFSIFWFFLTLLPESSFFPIKDVIFEHRLYLPMVGYSLFLVSGAYYLLGKNTIKTTVIALMMVIACNSVLTYQRNKVWGDELTLWDDTVGKSPHKTRPHYNRGLAYYRQGNFVRAISDYSEAIKLTPHAEEGYYNRGLAYYRQGKFTRAVSDYNKAIELTPKVEEVYNNRGIAYYQQGKLPQAISDYNEAIRIDPRYADAYYNRGNACFREGNFVEAVFDYDKAIELDPKDADAYHNRALSYHKLKKSVIASPSSGVIARSEATKQSLKNEIASLRSQ